MTALLLVALLAQSPRAPIATFAASAAADWASTYGMLRAGNGRWRMHEANPTIRWAERRPAAMIALGAGIDALGVVAWNRALGRRHPRVRTAGLYAASVFRVYLVGKNIRVIQRVSR